MHTLVRNCVATTWRARLSSSGVVGLITHKHQLCTVNLDVIKSLAEVCSKASKKLVIVHGAGSFGHMKAKEFRLAEGRIPELSQDSAIADVRNDMLNLNSVVVNELRSFGLDVQSYHLINGQREQVQIFLENYPFIMVSLLFTVMLSMTMQRIWVLSGDDLMLRYSIEIPDVERAVFAIGGVDGILRVPPVRAGPEDLIEVWNPKMSLKENMQQILMSLVELD